MITLELAEKYLNYRKNLPSYNHTNKEDYIPIQIITCPASHGVNEHPVIICKYWDNRDSVWRTKNVHITIDKFNDWMALRRDQTISELVLE